jgi:hypothetical protein
MNIQNNFRSYSRQQGLWLIAIISLVSFHVEAQTFRAGVARADITPPVGVEMWGYTDRASGATGTLDPLYARALVLDDGKTRVAVVTLDLGRSFGRASMDDVRTRVRKDHRIDDVIFIASHTHSGPVIEDFYEGGKVPDWEQRALDRIVGAIGEAAGKTVAARIGVGTGQIIIGHNRRMVEGDGRVRMLWRNATAQPTGVIDPSVGVMRIDDQQGRPMAVLVNYACHPVVFGSDNLRYSADYPGAMASFVERSFGGDPICFFLQGAPGDINPLNDKTPLEEDADNEMRRVGERIGKEVARVAKTIQTAAPAAPELALLTEDLKFKNRWNLEKLRAGLAASFGPRLASRYEKYIVPEMALTVTTLVINREIALVGLPGEPFVGLQLMLKERSPLAMTFLCGYTNGYFGYFPTIRDAVSGGYGADSVVTRVEVGAGERMVDRGIINIYRILGRLKDRPEGR